MFRVKRLLKRVATPTQIHISIPKRHVKLSVDRNRMKRWARHILRESLLYNKLQTLDNSLVIIYSPDNKNQLAFDAFKKNFLDTFLSITR